MWSIFLPHTRLWGINLLTYFPWKVAFLFTLLSLVFILPFFLKFWARIIEGVTDWILFLQQRIGTLGFTVAIVGLSVLLFWAFRSPVQLLGDGQLLINNSSYILREDVPIEPRTVVFEGRVPLTMVVYVNFARFLFSHFGIPVETILRLVSIIGGGIFIFLVLRFLKFLEADLWIIIVSISLLFFQAGIQLFFGYIEFYPLYFVSTFMYCFAGLLCLRGRVPIIIPFFALLLTIALYYLGVIFIPSFLYLFVQTKIKDKIGKWFTIRLILLIYLLSLVVFGFYYVQSGEYGRRYSFVPIVPKQVETLYTLLSPEHLLDLMNAFLLWSFPLLLILCVMLLFFRREVNWNDSPVIFLTISALYFILIAMVGNPELGFPRDWDFFVSSSPPIILLTIFILSTLRFSLRFKQYLAISVFGMSFFTVLPWVWINASATKSANRFIDILQLDELWITHNATTYGLDIVSRFLYDNDMTDQGVRVFAHRLQLKSDMRGFETLGAFFEKHKFKENDFEIVREALDKLSGILSDLKRNGLSLQNDPDSSFTRYHSLFIGFTEFYLQNGKYREALNQYAKLLNIEPSSGNAYLGIAKSLKELGHFSEAIPFYNKILSNPAALPDSILYDIGYCFYKTQQWKNAISYWELALKKKYQQPELRYFLGFAYYYNSDIQRAKENWNEYIKQNPSEPRKAEILDLLRRF